jgi:hypothetical protein
VIKIIVVASMIVLFGIHVKISGVDKEQMLPNGYPDAKIMKVRNKIIWLGRIIVGQSIAILLFAALMDGGI